MRIQRLVVVSFLALVLGATIGFIHDDIKSAAPSSWTKPVQLPIANIPLPQANQSREEFAAAEIDCLAEIVFREARSESVGIQRLTAITAIARRDDSDPQWPKTICGILHQPGQISQAETPLDIGPRELANLSLIRKLAEDVYEGAWKTQKLPRGWECVRYWRVSDEHLAKMNSKKFKQLGISRSQKGLSFFGKLEEVKTPPGTVAFFRDPARCITPLPTT